jgi:hypothetical protein
LKTYHYCTLFDSLYLSRALAMYDSLLRNCKNFHLYVFPFDDRSKEILEALQLKNVTLISLKEFEDERLLGVKGSRTKGEYCWTCTPATIAYCIERFNLDHCTYIDADLYFFSDPNVLIDEMDNNSVLITEHRYTKAYDQSATHGIYCVQFITFKNTADGLLVLNWWKDRCIEWCYARREDGKFGDQKYLDDWTTRFKGVHVLKNLGGGVAPWNVQQYKTAMEGNSLFGMIKSDKVKIVFYHFHYVKFYNDGQIDFGNYKFDKAVLKNIYRVYVNKVFEIEKMLQRDFKMPQQTQKYFYKSKLLTPLHRVARMAMGVYNIYTANDIKEWQS